MGQTIFIVLLIVAVVAVGVVSDRYMAGFESYTKAMAEREGRIADLRSREDIDGFNYYQIEHACRLWTKPYRAYADPDLNVLGDHLWNLGLAGLLAMLLGFIALLFLGWGV